MPVGSDARLRFLGEKHLGDVDDLFGLVVVHFGLAESSVQILSQGMGRRRPWSRSEVPDLKLHTEPL